MDKQTALDLTAGQKSEYYRDITQQPLWQYSTSFTQILQSPPLLNNVTPDIMLFGGELKGLHGVINVQSVVWPWF